MIKKTPLTKSRPKLTLADLYDANRSPAEIFECGVRLFVEGMLKPTLRNLPDHSRLLDVVAAFAIHHAHVKEAELGSSDEGRHHLDEIKKEFLDACEDQSCQTI